MTKKEIKNAINKAAYMFAESLGYQISDDNDGSYVTFSKPDAISYDNTIDWSRSHHETIVTNDVSDSIKADAEAIDAHMKPIIEHYKAQYGKDDGYNTDPNLTMFIDDKEWEREMGR